MVVLPLSTEVNPYFVKHFSQLDGWSVQNISRLIAIARTLTKRQSYSLAGVNKEGIAKLVLTHLLVPFDTSKLLFEVPLKYLQRLLNCLQKFPPQWATTSSALSPSIQSEKCWFL
jgi:hypothetical protein